MFQHFVHILSSLTTYTYKTWSWLVVYKNIKIGISYAKQNHFSYRDSRVTLQKYIQVHQHQDIPNDACSMNSHIKLVVKWYRKILKWIMEQSRKVIRMHNDIIHSITTWGAQSVCLSWYILHNINALNIYNRHFSLDYLSCIK